MGLLRLPRSRNTSFYGPGLRDGRTWREGVLSLKHRRSNETNQYHPTQQSPHENDWLPGNENVHGRTFPDEERLTITAIILRKTPDFRGHPCQSSSLRSCKPQRTATLGTRQLRARRNTAKIEATAAEKGWHRNYAEAPDSMRAQLFYCPHFLPAVAVSTTHYQQLLAPPVPRFS